MSHEEEQEEGEATKTSPLAFQDLLVTNKQQSLSVMDLLNTTSTNGQKGASVAIRRPRSSQQKTVFQSELPKETRLLSPEKEPWTLRCFCDVKSERGFMIQCDSCLTWQHAACVNINQNTLPTNYQCPICLGKHIRCRCQDNMNYRIPIVRCSKCGYWVHRGCEGLEAGPYHAAGHVCERCGGSPNQPPDVSLPYDLPVDNAFVTLTPEVINGLHPSISSAPFASIIKEEFAGKVVDAFHLLEILYNRFRPFFYLTHPQINFGSAKKKRGDVAFSFFRSVFYLLDYLYGTPQELAVLMFDILAKADIYLPYSVPTALLPSSTSIVEFSDQAKDEFQKMKSIPVVNSQAFPPIVAKDGGIYCTTPLQPEQLIGIASGLIGLVDEFCYDDGVDSQLYVVCATRFVLDTRKGPGQFIHNFRRSLSPNCVVKIFQSNGFFYAGIFAGVSDVNGIAKRTRRERFPIAANTELVLPIDFAPATIEEPADFMSWHFDEIEVQAVETTSSPPPQKTPHPQSSSPKHPRPSREEREELMVIRQFDRTKKGRRPKQEKEPKANKPMKRKPGKPARGIRHQVETVESSLFSLIAAQSPEPYLFGIPGQDDEQYEDMADASDGHREHDISMSSIDCSFIDKFLSVSVPGEEMSLHLTDEVAEMEALVSLSEL